MKKSFVYITVVCLLFMLCGCSSLPDDPLTPAWVDHQLNILQQSGETLTVLPNPAYEYQIEVTDQFRNILSLSQWKTVEKISENAELINAMIYFDLPHEDGGSFSRVAIFSNGYSLIQKCDMSQGMAFEDGMYYQWSDSEKDVFNLLIQYVDSSTQ